MSRACPSTRCVGEVEWPLQIPEAIGVELVRQASLAETGTSGAFVTPPHLPGRNPRWFGHPLSGQEGQRTAVVIGHQ